jgi:hypothetical protein
MTAKNFWLDILDNILDDAGASPANPNSKAAKHKGRRERRRPCFTEV